MKKRIIEKLSHGVSVIIEANKPHVFILPVGMDGETWKKVKNKLVSPL